MGFDGFFFWGSIHGMQEGFFKREIQINLSKDIGNWMEFRGWIFQELWISSANISFFESSKSVLTILGGIFVDGNNIWTFCDDLLSLAISGTNFKWEVPIPYIFGLYISSLNFRGYTMIYLQFIWPKIWYLLTYLHVLDPGDLPLNSKSS